MPYPIDALVSLRSASRSQGLHLRSSSIKTSLCVLAGRSHDNDGTGGMSNAVLAHGSEEHFDEGPSTTTSHDKHIGVLSRL